MLVCMYCRIHVHNLFRNQPNLAAVNQAQSLKLKHRAQDPCSSNWACVLFKKKKKEEVGKENLGEILCKKSQKFGGNKDALKMSL